MSGRVLGVDFGTVRIGLALSDPDRKIAFPHDTYTRRDESKDARFLLDLIAEERVTLIVVGLPVHLSGDEGQKAQEARSFGTWLASKTDLPLVYWDERFSTVQAESALWEAGLTHKQRKQRRDRVAAQIFLQAFLDAGCPEDADIKGLDDSQA